MAASIRQVAFLRAVNVGGRSIVRMADVQQAFAAAGCANVSTFIASGNILFEAPKIGSAALRTRIQDNMQRLLGSPPVVVYRTMEQLARLVALAPFGELAADRRLKLYVIFAAGKTRQRPAFPLQLAKEGLEAIGLADDDVLIVSHRKPNGMYGFPNNWIEKELGITSTARNWSTVRRLVEIGAKGAKGAVVRRVR
jgi:uncharacterized protein (DUF1697 family)